jgi:hypothetical protein
MYGDIGNVIDGLFKVAFWALVISIPLALWKVVDIAIWFINHFEILFL